MRAAARAPRGSVPEGWCGLVSWSAPRGKGRGVCPGGRGGESARGEGEGSLPGGRGGRRMRATDTRGHLSGSRRVDDDRRSETPRPELPYDGDTRLWVGRTQGRWSDISLGGVEARWGEQARRAMEGKSHGELWYAVLQDYSKMSRRSRSGAKAGAKAEPRSIGCTAARRTRAGVAVSRGGGDPTGTGRGARVAGATRWRGPGVDVWGMSSTEPVGILPYFFW